MFCFHYDPKVLKAEKNFDYSRRHYDTQEKNIFLNSFEPVIRLTKTNYFDIIISS